MFRRILVPIDASACSEKAAREAVELAKALGSSVVFLFVMDALRHYREGMMTEVRKSLSDEGEQSLVRAQRIAFDTGIDTETELLEGDPTEVITDRSAAFDLIVMASFEQGLWKRLTLGSVTQVVVHHVRCPVLLIPCARRVSAKRGAA